MVFLQSSNQYIVRTQFGGTKKTLLHTNVAKTVRPVQICTARASLKQSISFLSYYCCFRTEAEILGAPAGRDAERDVCPRAGPWKIFLLQPPMKIPRNLAL